MAASPSVLPSSSTDLPTERLSVSPPSLPRVCFVIGTSSNVPPDEYQIYIVDVNSNGVSHESEFAPTFLASGNFFRNVVFFALGWTDASILTAHTKEHKRGIYKYDFPSGSGSGSGSTVKVDSSMVVQVASLNCYKKFPAATPTPDGKKVVISSISISSDNCDFELFDPLGEGKKCRKLPQLHDFSIANLCFIEESVFLVQSAEGSYSLDLGLPARERRWQPYQFSDRSIFEILRTPFRPIGDGICLTTHGVYHCSSSSSSLWNLHSYPEAGSVPPGCRARIDMAPLDFTSNPRDCRFCVVCLWLEEVGDREAYVPHLMLDVYGCDVVALRGQEGPIWALSCTRKVKSFRFRLEPRSSYTYMWMEYPYCFPIPST